MDAKELRKNNLVFDSSNRPAIIEEIRQNSVKLSLLKEGYKFESFRYDEINPIPLTENWILRVGFIEREFSWFCYDEYFIGLDQINGLFTFRRGNVIICKIMYVHRFQNIWYDLTNEELKFN